MYVDVPLDLIPGAFSKSDFIHLKKLILIKKEG